MSKLGLGRFKSWAGGVMSSSEQKSSMSEELQRDLEEMDARSAGIDRMDRAMHTYVKYLSKRVAGENKDTPFPIANLGSTMIRQGNDMSRDNEFGYRLSRFGQTNVRIASFQEQFAADATSSWQESLERSMAQMKDYQAARKILEARRKEFETVNARVSKAKRDDPASEEELRKKTAAYEESQRDVSRRIQDIRDAEGDCIDSLDRFLNAELQYHENCMNALQKLRSDWGDSSSPSVTSSAPPPQSLPLPPPVNRSRSNTARSYTYPPLDEEPEYSRPLNPPASNSRPTFDSYSRSNSYNYGLDQPPADRYDQYSYTSRAHSPEPVMRGGYRSSPSSGATPAFEGPTTTARRNGNLSAEDSYFPSSYSYTSSTPRDRASTLPSRESPAPALPLRSKRSNVFNPPPETQPYDSLEDTPAYRPRTPSSSTLSATPGSTEERSRATSFSGNYPAGRKGPPPPPPSRAKKPPPPPPKKAVTSTY